MELYAAKKEAKEYLDFFAEPDERAKLEEYKAIILKEFYPGGYSRRKLRMSVCRRAVTDFRNLKPSPDVLADLMVFFVEVGCAFLCNHVYTFSKKHGAFLRHYVETLDHIGRNGLWEMFDARLDKCLCQVYAFDQYLHEEMERLYESARQDGLP